MKHHYPALLGTSIFILSIMCLSPHLYSADDPRQYSIPAEATVKALPIKPLGNHTPEVHVFSLDGKVVGRRLYYRSNTKDGRGSIFSEKLYKDGKPHGRWRKFFQNGRVFEELLYENGLLNGSCYWFDWNGHIIERSTIRNGSGLMKEFEKDGSLYKEFFLQNGLKQGLHKTWAKFSLGDSVAEGYQISNYESDKLQGWSRLYTSEDILISESMWNRGKLHGVTRRWDLAGNLLAGYPRYWINNKKVTKEEFEKAAKNDPILLRSLNSISNQKPVNEK